MMRIMTENVPSDNGRSAKKEDFFVLRLRNINRSFAALS